MNEGLLLKRTEEFMVNTEEEAKVLIENAKEIGRASCRERV